jgi:hypothetical protein
VILDDVAAQVETGRGALARWADRVENCQVAGLPVVAVISPLAPAPRPATTYDEADTHPSACGQGPEKQPVHDPQLEHRRPPPDRENRQARHQSLSRLCPVTLMTVCGGLKNRLKGDADNHPESAVRLPDGRLDLR